MSTLASGMGHEMTKFRKIEDFLSSDSSFAVDEMEVVKALKKLKIARYIWIGLGVLALAGLLFLLPFEVAMITICVLVGIGLFCGLILGLCVLAEWYTEQNRVITRAKAHGVNDRG